MKYVSVPASLLVKVRALEESAGEHISNNDCYAQDLREKMWAVREALAEIDKGE